MGEQIKILIVGVGSIGRRHINCLKQMDGIQLASLRSNKGEIKDEILDVPIFYNLEDALSFKPDGVVISNPTSLHVEMALPFLKSNIKVLIEKPVDTSLRSASRLGPYEELIRIAYCMRFNNLNIFLKNKFLKDQPFKVGFKRSFYLPKWHPYADYRKEYTALKSLGGGVIRTLSHEIDLSIDWFGAPKEITGKVDKISFLEMDTDDYAFFTTKTLKNIRVNFELDFFSPYNINQGEAFTKLGKYEWDSKEVFFTPYESSIKESVYSIPENSLDEMYQYQMEDFCNFIRGGDSINASLKNGIEVLKIIEEVEKK